LYSALKIISPQSPGGEYVMNLIIATVETRRQQLSELFFRRGHDYEGAWLGFGGARLLVSDGR